MAIETQDVPAPAPHKTGTALRPGSNRGGGPRLDSADWTVLLDIYLRHRSEPIGDNHPELVAASELLSLRASERGRPRPGANLRSTHGLARRLTVLRAIERGDEEGAPREALGVWCRFAADPAACEAEARRIAGFHAAPDTGLRHPARGPAPFAGGYFVEQEDGPSAVYLMELRGAVLDASRSPAGKPSFLKIGRSGDISRREAELNFGFPPGLWLRWTCVFSQSFSDAQHAHKVEQAVLGRLLELGSTIGGEFVRYPADEVRRLIQIEAETLLQENHLPALTGNATEAPTDGGRGSQ